MNETFYTQAEAAKKIGVSQSMISVYCKPDKITGKAKLANIRLGKRTLIAESDLMAFLDAMKIQASYS